MTKNSKIVFGLLALAAIGTGIYFYKKKKDESTSGVDGEKVWNHDGEHKSNYKDGDKIGSDCFNKASNTWGPDWCKKASVVRNPASTKNSILAITPTGAKIIGR